MQPEKTFSIGKNRNDFQLSPRSLSSSNKTRAFRIHTGADHGNPPAIFQDGFSLAPQQVNSSAQISGQYLSIC